AFASTELRLSPMQTEVADSAHNMVRMDLRIGYWDYDAKLVIFHDISQKSGDKVGRMIFYSYLCMSARMVEW
ncbi:MAG: hypothetical protein K2K37_12050, partial [Muribaculaceae bacterium]|nr:hypothetical protein [Muribaculaceae bacterium]